MPHTPFEFRYFTAERHKYVSCGWDGTNFINCSPENDKIIAVWDCPNFYPGKLGVIRHYYQQDQRLDSGVFNFIQGELTNIYITDELTETQGEVYDIARALKGEDGVDGVDGKDAPYPDWITDTMPTAAEVGAASGAVFRDSAEGGDMNVEAGDGVRLMYVMGNGENVPYSYVTALSVVSRSHSGFQLATTVPNNDAGTLYYRHRSSVAFADGRRFSIWKAIMTTDTQSLALSSPMAQSVSFDTQPRAIEQPAFEEGGIEQVADYWVYRYDTTENDGKFVANEVRIYGEPTKANITKVVMEAEFGKGYETNLLNDYNAVQLGIIADTGQTDRYKEMLKRRETLKTQIQNDLNL